MLEKHYKDFNKTKVATQLLLLNVRMLSLAFMKHLLDGGADINAQDYNGNTVLHIFSTEGKDDLVKYAVERGSNISIRNHDAYTAIDLAKSNHHYNITQFLRKSLIGPLESSFFLAVASNRLDKVKALVELGVNPNVAYVNGVSSLHSASLAGYDKMVSYLITTGVNVNALDDYNISVLHYALPGLNSTEEHRKITYELLINGADPSVNKDTDFSILYKLAYLDYYESLSLVVRNPKIDVNEIFLEYNLTALHASVANNHLNSTYILLAQGADITIKNLYGNTPYKIAKTEKFFLLAKILKSLNTQLISAAANNKLEIAENLLNKGANISASGYYDEDALKLASEKCHPAMVLFLLKKGARMRTDFLGENALFKAARKKCYSVVEILAKFADANLYAKNLFGYSVMDIIPEYKSQDLDMLGDNLEELVISSFN